MRTLPAKVAIQIGKFGIMLDKFGMHVFPSPVCEAMLAVGVEIVTNVAGRIREGMVAFVRPTLRTTDQVDDMPGHVTSHLAREHNVAKNLTVKPRGDLVRQDAALRVLARHQVTCH